VRILWFCNTPSLASEHLGVQSGESWVKALQHYFENDNVVLGIAFYWEHVLPPFELNGTKYFPIHKNIGKAVYSKTLHRIQSCYKAYPLFQVKHCEKVISDFVPDIIHIQGTENPFGLIKQFTKIPVVVSIQGNLTVFSKLYFRGVDKLNVIRKTPFVHWLLYKDLFSRFRLFDLEARVEGIIFRQNTYFIGRTDWDRRVSLVLNPKRRYFYGGEILRKSFYENKWSFRRKDKYVLASVIRANVYKGLETIVEAALLLKDNFGLDFRWNVVGIDKEDVMNDVLDVRSKFGDRIDFLGFMNEEKIIDVLLASDVYIHPSHIENSSNAVAEAQLLGMPVIATYAGGTGSIVKDGETGILIQDGDPWSLAGSIMDLFADPEMMVQLGERAHRVAAKRHDPARIYSDIKSIYTTILENER